METRRSFDGLRGGSGRDGEAGPVASGCNSRYIPLMDRREILQRLRAHEAELRGMGVKRLSLFGSVARGEAAADSDVDLAAEFDAEAQVGMFKYGAIAERLRTVLEGPVDLIGEPARTARMQAQIDRDRLRVY